MSDKGVRVSEDKVYTVQVSLGVMAVVHVVAASPGAAVDAAQAIVAPLDANGEPVLPDDLNAILEDVSVLGLEVSDHVHGPVVRLYGPNGQDMTSQREEFLP